MPVTPDVQLSEGVKIFHPEQVNLYGCIIGTGTKIGSFVEIQKNAKIGSQCKISSHSFICEGVTIEDEVFIGHGVMFTNNARNGGSYSPRDHVLPQRSCISKRTLVLWKRSI
jgi:UDP-2-acetamido-3-amino-2,3-dideoxy-glucuronate N-acetyltransferase